jgi:hypothetical protein
VHALVYLEGWPLAPSLPSFEARREDGAHLRMTSIP